MSKTFLQSSFRSSEWKTLLVGKWGERLLLVFIFLISVAAFLHFKEVDVDFLKLNRRAEKYIIAQSDFDFLDVEAMAIIKEQESRDIHNIYRFVPKYVQQERFDFERFLAEDRSWREHFSYISYEEISQLVKDFQDVLLDSRFTDGRTIQKIIDLDQNITEYYHFVPQKRDQIILPQEVWKGIRNSLMAKTEVRSDVVDFVLDHFAKKPWNLKTDLTKQSELRQTIEENLAPKYTHFPAGRRIIDAGEIVTPRHVSMIKSMKKALAKERNLWDIHTIAGNVFLAIIFTFLSIVYLYTKYRHILESTRKLVLLVVIILLTLALTKATEYLLLDRRAHLIDIVRYPLFVPMASLLVSVLLGKRLALFASGFLVIVMTLTLAVKIEHFLVINLLGALIGILCAHSMRRRREIFTTCGKIWLGCVPVVLAFNFLENLTWNHSTLVDIYSTLIFMIATAMIVIAVLPLLESFFHETTNMSLMEYLDPNHELLRRLSLELPGTYQHCLVVGNLAELAAQAIGVNGLFCRVATLYHDIGKLFNPHYFGENQFGGFNIHQLLTPAESAQVIIAHIREGVLLAQKYNLPQSFIDIIQEHHGTTLVYYFYSKQLEQSHRGEPFNIDIEQFRYNGPKPRSKESAIIMIADSVEAASRSLPNFSEDLIGEMIDRVIEDKAIDGQFDDCELTFQELGLIKKSMAKTLAVSHHKRIKYPTQNKAPAEEEKLIKI